MPLAGVAAAFEACDRTVPFHIAARQQAGLAGHFLQNAQPLKDLAAVRRTAGSRVTAY